MIECRQCTKGWMGKDKACNHLVVAIFEDLYKATYISWRLPSHE